MVRFTITDGGQVTVTEWEEETVRYGPNSVANQRFRTLRQQYPNARIAVERDSEPQGAMITLKLEAEGRTVARRIAESEVEAAMTELQSQYPNVPITRE